MQFGSGAQDASSKGESIMNPIQVGCRTCSEQAGSPCRNPDGVVLLYFHRLRIADAEATDVRE